MTYTTQAKTAVSLTAYHINDGAEVRIQLGPVAVDLDQKQREELAAYLLKENN